MKYQGWLIGLAVVLVTVFQNCAPSLSTREIVSNTELSSNVDVPTSGNNSLNSSAVGLAPKISCSQKIYHVGDYVDCSIENANSNTLCYQSGTSDSDKKPCTTYEWVLDSSKRQLRYRRVVTSAVVGTYIIYVENEFGRSGFDITYKPAAAQSNGNQPQPIAVTECIPTVFNDPLFGPITPSGIVGVKDASGKCGQPFKCDVANGYKFPNLNIVGSINEDPLRCSKYRGLSPEFTWGGASSLHQCSGSAGVLYTDDLNMTYSAFSSFFMIIKGDGAKPVKVRLSSSPTSDTNIDVIENNSLPATCDSIIYFNHMLPDGHGNPYSGVNHNAGNATNSYDQNICENMNAAIKARHPADPKSNRCTKIYDLNSGAKTPLGVSMWAVTCRCDSM